MARSRRAAPARRPVPARRPPQSRPASTKASPPPAPAPQMSHPPAPQPSGGGMLSGIGSTIAQGMAFGTGSAIAHRAVGAVANSFGGSGGAEQQPVEQAGAPAQDFSQNSVAGGGACVAERQIYYDCLRDNKEDGQVCQFLLEQLKACNQNQIYS